ncbi:hypothetical protein DOY81_007109, partial [Sarcophaga bullata]
MSFLEELKRKRNKLKACDTLVTTASGERFIEKFSTHKIEKINNDNCYGFVVDTKPDFKPAEILTNFLYLGSQDALTPENIKKYQLTHILSIGIECPLKELSEELVLLYVPCLDLPETSLQEDGILKKSFDFIERARINSGRVLVHCNAGVSRSASIIIAYLMYHHDKDFITAYNHVKTRRECIQP